jgi:glycosyltransferase involved in cell wall biosynthesis
MKIVHVVPGSLYKGGVGALVRNLCGSLAKRGNSVTAFYVSREAIPQHEKKAINGFSVKRVKPIIGDPFYVPPRSLIKDLDREKADVIHVHNIHTLLPLYIGIFRKHLSEKMVLQPHYHEKGQNAIRNLLFFGYKRILKSSVFHHFDAIIANSEYEKTCLETDFQKFSEKFVLVPEEYSLAVPSYMKWKPSTQSRRLLYVGSLSRYKNVDVIIRALRILMLKDKDVELIIIGDGPEKQRLMKLAFSLDVQDKITFKHSLPYDELLREYSTASIVVLLSTLESFSRVAHEAIAIGTPLIAYNYGPLSSLVKRGLAKGVHSLDPKEVADTIGEALSNGWKNIGRIQSLNGEVYVNLISKLYERLLK